MIGGPTYWPRPEREMRERAMEARLAAAYFEESGVLSVWRQYRCGGLQRADLVVVHGDVDARRYEVVECKANAANLVTLSQILRYMACLKRRTDSGTSVSGTIAAPRFTAELRAFVDKLDSSFLRLREVEA
jgi:RecB family endonuclease NucS